MRCETTLWADTALLKSIFVRLTSALRNPVGCLVDASDHLVLVLELGELGCDDTENHVLVLGKVRKWLETTGTRRVVFKVVCVNVEVLTRSIKDIYKIGRTRTWNSFFAMLSYAPSEK